MQKVCIALFVALTTAVGCLGQETCTPNYCLIACTKKCLPLTCPEGTEPGCFSYCQCCKTCVIPEGGQCPWTGDEPASGDVRCERNTQCCKGICSQGACLTTTSVTLTE